MSDHVSDPESQQDRPRERIVPRGARNIINNRRIVGKRENNVPGGSKNIAPKGVDLSKILGLIKADTDSSGRYSERDATTKAEDQKNHHDYLLKHLFESTGISANNTILLKKTDEGMGDSPYLADFSELLVQIYYTFRDIPAEYMDRRCYSPIRWLETNKNPFHAFSNESLMKGRIHAGGLSPLDRWTRDGRLFNRLKKLPPFSERFPARHSTNRLVCFFPIRGVSQFERSETGTSDTPGTPGTSSQAQVYAKVEPSRLNTLLTAHSPFTKIAFLGDYELTRQPCWRPLLDLKWSTHARNRFFFKWFVETTHGILFAIATSPDVPTTSPMETWNVVVHWIVVLLSALLLIDEIRQCAYLKFNAYLNVWNFIDLGSYIIPLAACARNLQHDQRIPDSWVSFGLVFVWSHFLQNCRIIESIGRYTSIIFEIILAIYPFLFILIFLSFSASHTLWSLLETYHLSDVTLSGYGSFYNSSLSTLWWITGDSTDIQPYVPFFAADIFRGIFSCVYIIFLLNVLIAILNTEYAKAAACGQERYQFHYMQIIAEMEVFYMLPHERKNPEKFPYDVYFEVGRNTIYKWLNELTTERNYDMDDELADFEKAYPKKDRNEHNNIVSQLGIGDNQP